MLRNILSGVAVVAFAASVSAQSQLPVQKAVQPKFAGVYKVASGEFIPASENRSGPEVIFNNTTPTNYYSVPGANQEWIDEGCLHDRNACDQEQINGLEFIYCSSDPSVTGTISLTFYDENVICSGPPNVAAPNCAYNITGLPMGTPTFGLQCWIVTVDLEGGFECPNTTAGSFRTEGAFAPSGLFGWGFIPALPNTGPWIRTGGDCRDNSFTWFDRNFSPPSFIGCYWFLGTPFASFSMKMCGNMDNSRAYYASPAQTLDTLSLKNTTDVQKLGPPETWMVTNPTAGHTYYLLASTGSANQVLNGFGGAQFTLLLSGAPNFLPPTPVQMPGGVLTAQVPAGAPANIFAQAVGVVGALNQGNVRSASNSVRHCF